MKPGKPELLLFFSKTLFVGTIMEEFKKAFRVKNETLEKKTADLRNRRVLLKTCQSMQR